eukprot:gene23689-biopygen4352
MVDRAQSIMGTANTGRGVWWGAGRGMPPRRRLFILRGPSANRTTRPLRSLLPWLFAACSMPGHCANADRFVQSGGGRREALPLIGGGGGERWGLEGSPLLAGLGLVLQSAPRAAQGACARSRPCRGSHRTVHFAEFEGRQSSHPAAKRRPCRKSPSLLGSPASADGPWPTHLVHGVPSGTPPGPTGVRPQLDNRSTFVQRRSTIVLTIAQKRSAIARHSHSDAQQSLDNRSEMLDTPCKLQSHRRRGLHVPPQEPMENWQLRREFGWSGRGFGWAGRAFGWSGREFERLGRDFGWSGQSRTEAPKQPNSWDWCGQRAPDRRGGPGTRRSSQVVSDSTHPVARAGRGGLNAAPQIENGGRGLSISWVPTQFLGTEKTEERLRKLERIWPRSQFPQTSYCNWNTMLDADADAETDATQPQPQRQTQTQPIHSIATWENRGSACKKI